jgi:glycerophosphoryl diester phosphodiesterase
MHQILEAFRLNWKLFLGIHIAVNIFSLLVLTPLVTLLMGWMILISGHTALTDEDILFFVLSPEGMIIMLLAGAMYATVVVFQQAAMITAAYNVTSGNAVNISRLVRYLLVKFWPLFRLALHMVGRTTLVATPFLAVGALIYFYFLTEFDINYYLTARPPVLWWAGGFILLCLLTLAGVLLRIFSGWVLALPLLLLDSESPARVLNMSRKASVSMRIPIAMTLLALFLLNATMLGLVSLLSDLAVDGVVMLAGESLKVMAYLLGGLLVVWLVANVAVTFFSNSVLSLIIIYLFARLVHSLDDEDLDERLVLGAPGRPWRVSGVKWAGVMLLVSLAAGLALSITMNRLDIEDNTMVIAHRGASADAPENTLAAMELAIAEGADWVELDVQETRDGEVVVIHDSDLKKIGGTGLKVFESSLAELQSVDIGSWKDPSFSDQRVPTLQQVLALCKDRINIVIELKYYGKEERLEERVVKLVEDAGMQDQIVVMSLNYPGIQKMKSLRPDWKVGLLASVAIGDITRLEADFFAINATFANRAFIKHAHKQNQKVLVWTVNDPISMSAMMSKGADGIITDKPALAATVRNERSEMSVHERMMIQLASFIGKEPVRPVQ